MSESKVGYGGMIHPRKNSRNGNITGIRSEPNLLVTEEQWSWLCEILCFVIFVGLCWNLYYRIEQHPTNQYFSQWSNTRPSVLFIRLSVIYISEVRILKKKKAQSGVAEVGSIQHRPPWDATYAFRQYEPVVLRISKSKKPIFGVICQATSC